MNRNALHAALASLVVGGAVVPLANAHSTLAGLSTDFWAGFLLSCALGLAILAVVTLGAGGRDRGRPNAGMTGGHSNG